MGGISSPSLPNEGRAEGEALALARAVAVKSDRAELLRFAHNLAVLEVADHHVLSLHARIGDAADLGADSLLPALGVKV